MPIGAFTGSFDLPLLLVIVFTLFFGALVFYLRQEDKREGYPLVSGRTERTNGRVKVVGFPGLPTPKTFVLPHGRGTRIVPRPEAALPVPAQNAGNPNGMPVNTTTPALGTNLGPGSWTPRDDVPDLSHDGTPVFRPMRHATDFRIMKGEADPRGYAVLGCDKRVAGHVVDVWIDESEHSAKFLEVELAADVMLNRDASATPADPREGNVGERATGDRVIGLVVTETHVDMPNGTIDVTEIEPVIAETVAQADRRDDRSPDADPTYGSAAAPAGSIMLPMEFAAVNELARTVRTGAITAAQFGGVPGRKYDTVITALEENRVRAYYGGGYLWATPTRAEPLL